MPTDTDTPASAPPPGPGLTYPWRTAPGRGQLLEVATGVFWLRMPLPFALDHINLWLLRDGDGWTLLDTGLGSDEIRAIWRTLIADLDGPIKRIIVSHFHPDHLGQAGWLQETCAAPLLTSASEWLLGSLLYYDADGRAAARMLAFFASHGLADEWLQALDTGNRYRRLVSPPPTHYQRLRAGDQILIDQRPWQVLVGLGHSPEHICLFDPELEVLLSGDQILPRITPNISVYASEPDANPLQDYLDSLVQFDALADRTLVLPAHGFPFRGLKPRLAYINEHHDDRFEELLTGIGTQTIQAAELVPVLFRRQLDAHQMMFAMGETLAHLACLQGRGLIVRERDARGHYWFRTA